MQARKKVAKGKKSPKKPKGAKKDEDDDIVYRKDADGNVYASIAGSAAGFAKGKKQLQVGTDQHSQASSSQVDNNSRPTVNGNPGTSYKTPLDNPMNKPTKRMFLDKKRPLTGKDENSDSDSSDDSKSDSSSDSSSSSDDDSESEAEESQVSENESSDDDGGAEQSSDNESDSDEDESEPAPKGKSQAKGKTKNTSKKGKGVPKKKTVSTKAKTNSGKNRKVGKAGKKKKKDLVRKRKSKWTDQENYTLVHNVSPKFDLLHGKFKKGSGGREARDEGWRQVTGNYVMFSKRTINQPKMRKV